MLKIKRGPFLALSSIVLLSLLIHSSFGNVSSELEINYINIAPQLFQPIPNQTWAVNTNLTNAFNLDDFMIDNDPLNYSASYVENVTIVINSSTHIVSFYSDKDFVGLRTVVFTATDGQLQSDSNVVTLNITPDTTPPMWSSLSLLPPNVHQNTIVTMSAKWTDDIALKKFFVSINQGGSWINQSAVEFTGKENTSSYSIQISAPAGTVVSWYITAFDTTSNANSTNIQNFTVREVPPPPQNPPVTPSEPATAAEQTIEKEKKYSFVVDPENGFIIELLKGEDKTISFKVTNTGNVEDSFKIDTLKFEGFNQIISKNNFTLSSGNTAVITINFAAKDYLLPDIYIGSIRVQTPHGVKLIPVIIQLNELHTVLAMNVTVANKTEFLPKDTVSANIELTNIQDIQPREVYLYYAISDFNGNILDSSSDQFTFNSHSVTLQKQLKLPADVKVGTYIFFARAIANGSIVLGSDSFTVGVKRNLAGFILTNLWILLLIAALIVAAFILAIEHRNKKRLKLLNLYVMVNELRQLIKENNLEEALKVFIKIKGEYGEPIADSLLNNKEQLFEEMKKFANTLDSKILAGKIVIMKNQENKPQDGSKQTASTDNKQTNSDKKPDEKADAKNQNKEEPQKKEIKQTEPVKKDKKKKSPKKLTKHKKQSKK